MTPIWRPTEWEISAWSHFLGGGFLFLLLAELMNRKRALLVAVLIVLVKENVFDILIEGDNFQDGAEDSFFYFLGMLAVFLCWYRKTMYLVFVILWDGFCLLVVTCWLAVREGAIRGWQLLWRAYCKAWNWLNL